MGWKHKYLGTIRNGNDLTEELIRRDLPLEVIVNVLSSENNGSWKSSVDMDFSYIEGKYLAIVSSVENPGVRYVKNLGNFSRPVVISKDPRELGYFPDRIKKEFKSFIRDLKKTDLKVNIGNTVPRFLY